MIPFICKYCGKDTSEVEYDYLHGHDHLSCALEADNKAHADDYDHCILCGVETAYKRSTHIDMRHGYIEGAGQLCSKCHNFDKSSIIKDEIPLDSHRQLFTVSEYTVLSTPNDMELGAKVRQLYWENKK
jgi:hypothetical protein